jgi:photosystem II stability/assembly factor-like uncharacterized protein
MTTVGLSPNGEAFSRSNDRVDALLVGTVRGVVRLERTGDQWNVGLPTLDAYQVAALVCDQQSGMVIAATLRPGGIFVSQDGGTTWSDDRLGVAGVGVFSLSAVKADDGQDIYAGCEPVRLYRSHDLGQTWHELPAIRSNETEFWIFPTPPKAAHLKHIGSHPAAPKRLFASIEQGALLESGDAGETWTEVETFLTPEDRFHSDIHRVAISPSNPNDLFMSTGEGFYRSLDGGKTWEHLLGKGARIAYPDPLFIHPRDHSTLFLAGAGLFPGDWISGPTGTANPAVLRSDDKGTTWYEIMSGLPSPIIGNIEAMSIHDSGDALTCFLGTTQGEVYVSDDDGKNWGLIASGLPPISKSAHYRKFLSEEERARVEEELRQALELPASSAV